MTTTLGYDSRDRLTSVSVAGAAGNATTTLAYDLAGNITQITRPNGASLSYTYDAAHRLTKVTDGLGQTITYTLDALGGRTQVQVAASGGGVVKTQSKVFDELGRMLQSIGASSQTTTYAYDKNNNVTGITDPRGNGTGQTFDALNRLIQTAAPLSITTSYGYDARNNTVSVTDPNAALTTYVCDGLDDLIETVSPDSGTSIYVTDATGNRTSKTDARGVVTNYTYDLLSRVTSKTFPAYAAENVTYTYDETTNGNLGIGHLTSLTDAAGSASLGSIGTSASFSYDAYGNLVTYVRVIGTNIYTTGYAYDLAGNLTQITYPSGRSVSYQLDSLGRATAVTTKAFATSNSVTLASNVQYLPFGGMSSLKLGNNEQVTYSFDQDYQLTGISATSPTRQGLTLGHDPNGNITSIADAVNSNRSQTFQYDALNRVSQAVGFYGTDNLTYDAVGNRSTWTTATDSTSYTYNPGSNQLASWNDLTSGAVYSFAYDAAGNQLTRSLNGGMQLSIAYNAAGRPHTAATETYTYDGFGKRVMIGVPSASTQDIFDPASGRLLAENNAGAQPQRTYVYLNGISIALVSGFSSINYVLSDQLGQPQKLVDGFATLTWDRVSDAFGSTVSQAKGISTAIALRFPGQEYDAITGLHYNDQRDYDPTLGRYIQSDPIGLEAGTNTYNYARGNPALYVDQDGRFAWVIAGAVIGSGINVAATVIANGGFDGLTAQQLAAAAIGGAIAGGLGSIAGPLGGSLALELGFGSSSGAAAIGISALLTSGASAAGQEASNLIDPCDAASVANAAFWGSLGGGLAKFIPTKNLNSWAQANHFGATTLSGIFGSPNAWLNNGATAASAAVGTASNFPAIGPF